MGIHIAKEKSTGDRGARPARPSVRKPKSRYHHGTLHDAALQAAARELDERGHVSFTMERVGKRLGVTTAALYRHFENRHALLREVMWQTFLRYVEAVDGKALAAPRGEGLAAIAHSYVAFAMENPGWFRLQFSRSGAALDDRQARAHPRYGDVMLSELTDAFGEPAPAYEWLLQAWIFVHGVACFCVEHIGQPFETDEQRLASADRQIAIFLGAMRAAAAEHKAATAR